jgi:DNA invertase Pin-like site-specific DNA recombinase/DNA-binding transcriptional MerR regulator
MYKVAIYVRLSKEDQDKLNKGDDSASIQNQKMMLVDYAISHEMQIYHIYADDDYAGSDTNRPEWIKMIKDAEIGKFDIILCKTQARFARSMEVVEKYINGCFAEWGIRFISIVDNIDTNIKATKKNSQINGLVDQWYLEDLSENIKRTFRQKMKAGQYLGGFAPYGYIKDPNDKHKIIIDEEAAKVVRLIFDLSLQGYGVNIISQKLSEMKIPTPTEHKKNQGFKFYNPNSQIYSKKGLWGYTTVKRILNNPVYIGTLIQGREKKVSYKSKKVVVAPKDEWVVIENNHEPIISKEVFEKTQKLLQIRRKTCKTTSGQKFQPHLFSGKIRCADCNSAMTKTSGRLAGGYDYFMCQLGKKTKYKECTRHSIRYNTVEKYVDLEIKKQIKSMLEYGDNIEEIKKHFNKDATNDKKILSIKKQLQKNENKVDNLNKSISSLYVDKVSGIVDENDFITIKENINIEIQQIKDKNLLLSNDLKSLTVDNKKINNFMDAVHKYANYEKLTFEIVNDFIECIYIHEANENGELKIDIKWNI